MATLAPQTRETMSFGRFSLVASERLLTRDGAAVPLGPRPTPERRTLCGMGAAATLFSRGSRGFPTGAQIHL